MRFSFLKHALVIFTALTLLWSAPAVRAQDDFGFDLTGESEKKKKGDVVSVWRAPPWRRELAEEVDLIEEVGRIYGYDRLPGRPTMRLI